MRWLRRFLFRRYRVPGTDKVLPLGGRDFLRRKDVNAGVLVLGAPGSGKTTAVLAQLFIWLALLGASLVVCPAKGSDKEQARRWARLAGREGDFFVFGEETGQTFNWLGYLLRMGGVGAVVPVLQNLQQLLNRNAPASADAYFMPQGVDCLSQAIRAVWLATGDCCVRDVHEYLNTFPRTEADVDEVRECDPGTAPYAYRILRRLASLPATPEIDFCLDFWLHQFPLLGRSEKTQACVLAISQSIIRQTIVGPVGACMSGPDSTFTPEMLERGVILFIDFPVLTGFEPARLAQAVFTICVNRYALARRGGIQIVTIADEHPQTVLEGEDSRIAATGRSQDLGRILVAQNMPQYAANLGAGERGMQEARSLVGCMGTVILCANGCRETNQHFSDTLGNEPQLLFGGGTETGGEPFDAVGYALGTWQPKAHCNFSQHLQPVLPPQTFLTLRAGGTANGFAVDAVVIAANRTFADGRPFKFVSFNQVL